MPEPSNYKSWGELWLDQIALNATEAIRSQPVKALPVNWYSNAGYVLFKVAAVIYG